MINGVNSRMSLLVTIFFMLVNIGNSERSNMPDAESMTAMDVWILSCMGFLAAGGHTYMTSAIKSRQKREVASILYCIEMRLILCKSS